jgi:Uma2 family endonuclease
MVSIAKRKSAKREVGEPAWDIARLFPAQGRWEVADYLALDTNYLVEFTDGFIEVLPMPTPAHQRIVLHLLDELHRFTRRNKLGEVLVAPMRVRLETGEFREPDVMFMLAKHAAKKGDEFWNGADLVTEVVSDDTESQERDYAKKRTDYASAGIAEYWIVDPQSTKIMVLKLRRGHYVLHGEFGPGQRATSVLVAGFSVDVDEVFRAAVGD